MNPLANRAWVLSVIAAVVLVATYLALAPEGGALPSGRSPMGYTLGLLGTLAMIVAGAYSWRRRFIARASRPIEIGTNERKELIARERVALEQLQALARSLMRNPGQDLRAIRRETKRILKNNRVGRTIEARVESGRGTAPRLVLQRREWGGRLQTWYVAHLSLGVLSVLLILLHAGFRFGNVIATLAFVCLVGVVLTGIAGVWLYWVVPPALTVIEERAERSPEELREDHVHVCEELEATVEGKSDIFRRVYQQEISIPGVSMKPSLGWLLAPAVVERDTARPDRLRLIVKEIPPSEQEDFRKAMRLIFRKEKIEVSLYPQLRYDYLLKVWLTAHIPLSAGLAAFSVIHIVSVFAY